ncbi:MAG: DUF2271 domain-containing protein [Polyangiales bacterium]
MIRTLCMLAALAVALTQAAHAHAYSDPTMFNEPALRGGGAGRQYTGSPADGYTCATCHRGGAAPGLFLYGMPEVLDPGTTYQITLRWTQPEISHALQLELLTERGETPVVTLTPEPMVTPLSRCESLPDGELATYAVDLPGRRVLGVRDCGAGELSFSFVAPQTERVYVTASLVRSDSMGTAEGDGVLDLARTLYRRDVEPDASDGCALVRAGRGHTGGAVALLLALAWAFRGRRRGAGARAVMVLGALLLSTSCYGAEQSADDVVLADGGLSIAFDAAVLGGLDARTAPAAPAGLTLYFRVQTKAYGGKYAPRNIGAIWVERAEGGYVKTLERWAGTRAMFLRNWRASARDDLTDAITGATLATHTVHEVRWNFTDVAGAVVPDGNYRLAMETTDRDATGAVHYVPFVKSGTPGPLPAPAPSAQFVDMELRIDPPP